LAPADAPRAALAQEAVVRPRVAGNVDLHALQRSAHEQHQPRLGDRALAADLDRRGTHEVLRAALAFLAQLDELRGGSREPARLLRAIWRVQAAQPFPAPRVAPERPVAHRLDDGSVVGVHSGLIPAWRNSAGHFSASPLTKARVSCADMAMMRQ